MSDAALNGVLARLTSIEAQAYAVAKIGAELLRETQHNVPGSVEKHESAAREAETLHTLTRSALSAMTKLCDRVDSERNRRITDRVIDGAMPVVHNLVIGGKRAEDPPLTLTFDLSALERA